MNFLYRWARLPGGKPLLRDLNDAAHRLHCKLKAIDMERVDINPHTRWYLGNKIMNAQEHFALNTFMLGYLLSETPASRTRSVLVDLGGGTGTISFMAKELGIGTVIYNNIYEPSCRDAETIGRLIGCEADYYVHGDIADVIGLLSSVRLDCNMLASNDCIEHVYDVASMLRRIRFLSTRGLAFWLSSAANPFRWKSRRAFMRLQRDCECRDREPKAGDRECDTRRSLLSIRREIVLDEAGALTDGEVEALAERTRGLREDHIRLAVRFYVATGRLLAEPDHPTNTCDPYTGNYVERLMNPLDLSRVLEAEGFATWVLPGYWDASSPPAWKSVAKCVFNTLLSILGRRGLHLAPYYVVCGVSSLQRSAPCNHPLALA